MIVNRRRKECLQKFFVRWVLLNEKIKTNDITKNSIHGGGPLIRLNNSNISGNSGHNLRYQNDKQGLNIEFNLPESNSEKSLWSFLETEQYVMRSQMQEDSKNESPNKRGKNSRSSLGRYLTSGAQDSNFKNGSQYISNMVPESSNEESYSDN